MSVSELLKGCGEISVIALTRAGRAELPSQTTTLNQSDILTVSATFEGVKALRAKLQESKEA
ncbi:MAG: hypothetical protein HC797_00985 [Anaerolineales bacterium]|nr:hypothetical protein [Anaerolineales bacterium]